MKVKGVISTGKGYAYLKIAEGCDNQPHLLRYSVSQGTLQEQGNGCNTGEVEKLASSGIKLILAQDTTKYGMDIYGRRALAELLREIGK